MAGPYFVDDVSGNDGNGGLSWGDAWATVAKALGAGSPVAAGETVFIGPSHYYEDVTLAIAGTAAARILVKACDAAGGNTFMMADTPTVTVRKITGAAGKDYIDFMGIQISGATGAGWNMSASDYMGFYRCGATLCSTHGFDLGLYAAVVGCVSTNNTDRGFHGGGVRHLTCQGCVSRSNSGLYQYSPNANAKLIDCAARDIGTGAGFLVSYRAQAIGCIVEGHASSAQAGSEGFWVSSAIPAFPLINCSALRCDVGFKGSSADLLAVRCNTTGCNTPFDTAFTEVETVAGNIVIAQSGDDWDYFKQLPGSVGFRAGWPDGVNIGSPSQARDFWRARPRIIGV